MQSFFDRYHPAVTAFYCVVALLFSMCIMQPVYVLLTFAGLMAWHVALDGARAFRSVLWQAPLILLLAVANPIFVGQGSTELFRIGAHPVYLEAALYGVCQGFMLVNVLLGFSSMSKAISSDKFMALLGNAAPVVALMVSMTMRLVPQFARRGKDVLATSRACTAASSGGRRVDEYLRLSTVLVGWGLEDSLETADSMRSRGWGVGKRTSYMRYRFRFADAVALGLVVLLALTSGVSAWAGLSSFSFYPAIDGWPPLAIYIPYGLLIALPTAAKTVFDIKEKKLDD